MKSILTIVLVFVTTSIFSQGWIGKSDSLLISYNSSPVLNPIRVGIGTSTPTAQFHTTGSVRFAGITNNNTHSRVLVQNTSGDVYWRDAASIGTTNAWSLTGNSGTTAANFLGTTDNLALRFRVNNSERFSITPVTVVGSNNVSYVGVGDPSATSNNPTQLYVNGKDISGFMLPFNVNASVAGMTWSQVGGVNNTLGRLVRWTQWTNNTNNQFYDQGIDQEGDFYITARGLSGTGGVLPKKMLQISSTDNVGINMSWAENPTANFHTKGTVRFETLPSGTGNILVIDAQGNVFRSSTTAARVTKNESLQKELNDTKQTIRELQTSFEELKKEIAKLKGQFVSANQPYIKQNSPNPGSSNTMIEYYIPNNKKGKVLVYDALGKLVKIFDGLPNGANYISLDLSQYKSGTYLYSLVISGKKVDSKKMIVN